MSVGLSRTGANKSPGGQQESQSLDPHLVEGCHWSIKVDEIVSGLENSCALECSSGDVGFGWVSLRESGVFRRNDPFREGFSRKELVVW